MQNFIEGTEDGLCVSLAW